MVTRLLRHGEAASTLYNTSRSFEVTVAQRRRGVAASWMLNMQRRSRETTVMPQRRDLAASIH